jgi:hypothetical protein
MAAFGSVNVELKDEIGVAHAGEISATSATATMSLFWSVLGL